ncbi:MAG: carotenoid biosynthesis protein [bacterium]|nr:carotenoid biosynthesis protein [bacterium]
MTAIVVAWALLAAGFSVVTLVRLGWRSPPPPVPAAPPVLLLRPADVPSAAELTALATPLAYPGPLAHVVISPARPALPPGVEWLASDPATPNRKVGHLLAALAALAPGERVVLAIDADVAVDAVLVQALAAAVAGGAALATAAPAPEPAAGLVPRAVRALLCHTQLSFAALDAMAVGAHAICGKAMALSPAALDGLPPLRDRVGEDLELAAWLHARALPVALVAPRARVPQASHAPAAPALARFVRWMQVLRAHRPALALTVPLLFTPTLPLVLGAALAASPIAWLAVGTCAGVRTLLAWRLEPRGALGWPLGEALLLVAFVRALVARTVTWRGRTFRLARGGRMEPVTP